MVPVGELASRISWSDPSHTDYRQCCIAFEIASVRLLDGTAWVVRLAKTRGNRIGKGRPSDVLLWGYGDRDPRLPVFPVRSLNVGGHRQVAVRHRVGVCGRPQAQVAAGALAASLQPGTRMQACLFFVAVLLSWSSGVQAFSISTPAVQQFCFWTVQLAGRPAYYSWFLIRCFWTGIGMCLGLVLLNLHLHIKVRSITSKYYILIGYYMNFILN
jgi:hypothetical protein